MCRARRRCGSPTAPGARIADERDGSTHLPRDVDASATGRRAPRRDVELPPGHESLNVVIPWSDRRFQFTSKHQARPARGELVVADRTWSFGGATAATPGGCWTSAAGRWPYRTRWNWGGGAGRQATAGHRPAARRPLDRGHRVHRERRARGRHASQAGRRAALAIRLGRPDAPVARGRPGRAARHRARAALRQAHEDRGRAHGDRDPSGVRELVGSGSSPTWARRSS